MGSAGPVRQAARQVSAYREIFFASVAGISGGLIWRSWHLSYKKGVEDFYKKYDEDMEQKAS